MTTIGHCIVCQRDIAVRPTGEGAVHSHNLVHHGYNRPGIGCIVGDCFGVRHPPHELADYTARRYHDFCEMQRQRLGERLKLLETYTIACVHVEVVVPVPTTAARPLVPWWNHRSRDGSIVDPGWTRWMAPYYPNETESERQQTYQKLCRSEADRTKGEMRMLAHEIARMLDVIPKWEPQPLRERQEAPRGPPRRRRRRVGF